MRKIFLSLFSLLIVFPLYSQGLEFEKGDCVFRSLNYPGVGFLGHIGFYLNSDSGFREQFPYTTQPEENPPGAKFKDINLLEIRNSDLNYSILQAWGVGSILRDPKGIPYVVGVGSLEEFLEGQENIFVGNGGEKGKLDNFCGRS